MILLFTRQANNSLTYKTSKGSTVKIKQYGTDGYDWHITEDGFIPWQTAIPVPYKDRGWLGEVIIERIIDRYKTEEDALNSFISTLNQQYNKEYTWEIVEAMTPETET